MDWESARKRWCNCVQNDGARVDVFVFVFVLYVIEIPVFACRCNRMFSEGREERVGVLYIGCACC